MTTLREIGEFRIIDRIAKLTPGSPQVVHGIGDDCAVVRIGDELIAVTCDLLLQDVHFRFDPNRLFEIGWKTAAASLSDVAAMGARPMFALCACGAPSNIEVEHLEEVFRGMNECLGAFGSVLAGGDTTCHEAGLILDMTLIGRIEGQYALRAGAAPGDIIAVTGYPGRSAAGLQAQEQGFRAEDLIRAHVRPTPRVEEGRWLLSHINAMIDVSDGVVQDAGHMAAASGLTINLDAKSFPIAQDLASFCGSHGLDAVALALAGGEDYELVVALPPDNAEGVRDAFEEKFDLPLTPVGVCESGPAEVRVNGQLADSGGFDHFRVL